MNCSRALKLISILIDDEATEQQKRLLDFHLMGCRSCRKALSVSRNISRLTRDLPVPAPPEDLESRVRIMISQHGEKVRNRHRFRTAYLAAPAIAALLLFAFAPNPISTEPDALHNPALPAVTTIVSKANDSGSLSKARTRTAPLYAYSRPASLISF